MNYFDTSALIKRFVSEAGSSAVDRLISASPASTSVLAYVEVHSGFSRKLREGSMPEKHYRRASRQFEDDFSSYIRIEVSPEIVESARDLVQRRPLRALDALHLASAVNLQDSVGEPVTFVAADRRLLAAAEAEDLKVIAVEA
jgi:predicted nucleic acid-binding protein